jgi:O-6-methylguanine DNA methyltransferase
MDLITYRIIIDTPLGKILAKANENAITALNFVEKFAENEIICSTKTCKILIQLKKEISEYFAGKRKVFSVPVWLQGTDFQIKVWQALQKIPYGTTLSYSQHAQLIGNQNIVRAVANANGKNKILILVPCHRVIGSNGSLTGFSSGLWRKKLLLDLELTTL